ncbi:MAG: hypothetical protein EXS64_16050 [Candidatus Latescibacteria bacterium]|nr:hypothetical protein [Candidatus Latescibacterota bacterium]
MFPDPEPFTTEDTGDYFDGHDDPKPEPEAEAYEPPICQTCNAPADDWDSHCPRCGHPMTTWGELHDMMRLEDWKEDFAVQAAA